MVQLNHRRISSDDEPAIDLRVDAKQMNFKLIKALVGFGWSWLWSWAFCLFHQGKTAFPKV